VVTESAVLRINICAEKPAHRKSAKRYAKPMGDREDIKLTSTDQVWWTTYGTLNAYAKNKFVKKVHPLQHTKHTFIFLLTRNLTRKKMKECFP
jgi:hypothetical protein